MTEDAERCPTCDSPRPHLHPAVQYEGEVQLCRDAWHGVFNKPIEAARRAAGVVAFVEVLRAKKTVFPLHGHSTCGADPDVVLWRDVEAALDSAGREARSLVPRLFPIQNVGLIPWSLAERAYVDYARRHGTGQSLERLAERGGFGLAELGMYLSSPRGRLDGTASELNLCCEYATKEILKAIATGLGEIEKCHE